jgi:peptidoglycan/LPS O-acetylase OafA/YrhL
MQASDKRILGFDGLRAIAFTLVFLSHKITFAYADPYGTMGVSLFFVLSGFLITRILASARDEVEAGRSTLLWGLGRFYWRRTARIFPPYYALLALIGLISLLTPIENFWRYEKLAYAFYATNILVAYRGHWIGDFGHFWSLAVEEQFYLLFAPLVLLVPRRHTLKVCAAVIATGIAVQIALEMSAAAPLAIGVNSFVNFILLGYGGMIGLSARRRLPAQLASGTAQLAVLAFFVALPALVTLSPDDWSRFATIPALLAGPLLLQIYQGQSSWFVGVLNSPALRGIGRISYGAYLIHPFIHAAPMLEVLASHGIEVSLPWSAATALEYAITIAIAAASWHYLEKPIVEWAARSTAHAPLPVAGPAR